jgi:hypothetical protein
MQRYSPRASSAWRLVTFMGMEKKTTSFRLSPETLAQIGEIQNALAPFIEDRSQAMRFVVGMVYAMIFTPWRLEALLDNMQRLLCTTSQSQMRFRFPGVVSLRPTFSMGSRAERRPV